MAAASPDGARQGLDEDAEGHRPEDLVLLLGKCSGLIECILPISLAWVLQR